MKRFRLWILEAVLLITASFFMSSYNMNKDVSFKVDDSQRAYDECLTAEDYYSMIPADIRYAFETSDWTWTVYKDGSLAGKFGYDTSIMGLTIWPSHEIWIDRRKTAASAIVHEIGHWASKYYDDGIDEMQLSSVYEEEWNTLYDAFGGSVSNYNTEIEFVAEAFSDYILEPDKLQNVAPQTYTLMDTFINDTTDGIYDTSESGEYSIMPDGQIVKVEDTGIIVSRY